MRNKVAKIPNIESIHTFSGSPVRTILEPRFDGSTTKLVSVGEENIQDRIEAEAPYTDINYMLNRLSLGDMSVLSQKRPMYGDFTGLPSDPIEALNLVHQSEFAFSQLSSEEKQKYNNDWKRWFAYILSSHGDVSRDTISEVVKPDVSESVSKDVPSVADSVSEVS